MKSRNWTEQKDVLLRLINAPRFGVISDFDGTLAAFADTPNGAVIVPEIAALVDALAEKVIVFALVSGRGVSDLRGRFERPWAVYYGNHGIEYWTDGGPQNALQAQPWVEPLQTLLHSLGDLGVPGAFVEDKGVTAAVHYRLTDDPPQARETLRALLLPLCDKYGFHLSEGQAIFEIKPPIQLNKGTAAQDIVEDHRLKSVLFLGDDITDIYAMKRLRALAEEPERGLMALSVGVVHEGSAPALLESCDMTAKGVKDVEALLAWLNENRTMNPSKET